MKISVCFEVIKLLWNFLWELDDLIFVLPVTIHEVEGLPNLDYFVSVLVLYHLFVLSCLVQIPLEEVEPENSIGIELLLECLADLKRSLG